MASNYETKMGASINSIKEVLVDNFGYWMGKTFEDSNYYNRERYDKAYSMQKDSNAVVDAIAGGDFGKASDIAKTVLKNKRISEPQAYWIARTAWENELDCVFVDGTAKQNFIANKNC